MAESTVVVNICSQRTGSKFFGSCLRAGVDFVPLGEIFNPDEGQAFTFWSWLAVNGQKEFGNRISTRVLDRFFNALFVQFGPFYFDLMYNQMSAITPSWTDGFGFFVLEYFKRNRFHVIHTERNPADIFSSLKKLEATGVAHARTGLAQVETKRIEVSLDTPEYRAFRKNYFSWAGAVNQTFADYDRFFGLSFDRLTSEGGRLPPDLLQFLSVAARRSGNEYGDHVQIRDSVFGKAPQIVAVEPALEDAPAVAAAPEADECAGAEVLAPESVEAAVVDVTEPDAVVAVEPEPAFEDAPAVAAAPEADECAGAEALAPESVEAAVVEVTEPDALVAAEPEPAFEDAPAVAAAPEADECAGAEVLAPESMEAAVVDVIEPDAVVAVEPEPALEDAPAVAAALGADECAGAEVLAPESVEAAVVEVTEPDALVAAEPEPAFEDAPAVAAAPEADECAGAEVLTPESVEAAIDVTAQVTEPDTGALGLVSDADRARPEEIEGEAGVETASDDSSHVIKKEAE